jgi:hypothetical protein
MTHYSRVVGKLPFQGTSSAVLSEVCSVCFSLRLRDMPFLAPENQEKIFLKTCKNSNIKTFCELVNKYFQKRWPWKSRNLFVKTLPEVRTANDTKACSWKSFSWSKVPAQRKFCTQKPLPVVSGANERFGPVEFWFNTKPLPTPGKRCFFQSS